MRAQDNVRAAVVGAGNIARHHLAALQELPGVSIAAVCDMSRAAAEATAERYHVETWHTDYRLLLEEVRPDVVHVTTPPAAHFELALAALDAGAHVVVEKPLAPSAGEVDALVARSRSTQRALVENYNYLFNRPVRGLLAAARGGELGSVLHVEVALALELDGGSSTADYVPHLASLAHAFMGGHRSVEILDSEAGELRALVVGERATAALLFSGRSRPDAFTVRVHGTAARAEARIFEPSLVIDRDRRLPRPLVPVVNGIEQASILARAAVAGFWEKLRGGPGSYEGLREHLRQTYEALRHGVEPPVTLDQLAEVNRLGRALIVSSQPAAPLGAHE